MLLVFGRIAPTEFTVIAAFFDIHLEFDRLDGHQAFEHMQLRADREHIGQWRIRAETSSQLGVVSAGVVSHASQQAARLLDPEALDEFSAEHAHRGRMQHQHALIVKPDMPVFRRKMQPGQKVGDTWIANLIDCRAGVR